MTDDPAHGDDGTDRRGAEPDAVTELTPAQRAAIEAAKAAKKARKAQREAARQAERARRLAAEYAELAGADAGFDEPAAPAVEPGTDPAVEPATGAAADAGAESSRTPLLVAAVALVLCVAFAVVALVVHVRGSGPSARPATAVRDDVLLSARQDIVVLNSLDYRHLDAGLARWSDASTGALHDSFQHVTPADRNGIAAAKAVTTAHVLEAAVVSLDAANGSATVIASVELTVTPSTGQAVTKRERQRADVTRVGGVWKISGLQQVGVTVQ